MNTDGLGALMMKAHKYKLLCPFCGSECDKYANLAAKTLVGSTIVMYRCKNKSCGAVMSFDNIDCNLNPNATDRYFLNRYLGGDSDAE